MRLPLKKAARSLQVLAPSLQEARFAAHLSALRLMGRAWRPDAEAVRYFIVDAPTILDIGANRGFSISSFQMLKPKSRIVAFEPISHLAKILSDRYRDVANISVHSCALAAVEQQMRMYIPIYRGFVFDPLASLDYHEAADWVNPERFYFFNPKKLRIEEESVDVRRLDDFGFEPDIVKIIAQGYEPPIIEGGEETIKRYEPAIMVPARIPRTSECLRSLGYARYAFRDKKFLLDAEGHTFTWYLKPKHVQMFQCQFS